jgi:hypothetical protein
MAAACSDVMVNRGEASVNRNGVLEARSSSMKAQKRARSPGMKMDPNDIYQDRVTGGLITIRPSRLQRRTTHVDKRLSPMRLNNAVQEGKHFIVVLRAICRGICRGNLIFRCARRSNRPHGASSGLEPSSQSLDGFSLQERCTRDEYSISQEEVAIGILKQMRMGQIILQSISSVSCCHKQPAHPLWKPFVVIEGRQSWDLTYFTLRTVGGPYLR